MKQGGWPSMAALFIYAKREQPEQTPSITIASDRDSFRQICIPLWACVL